MGDVINLNQYRKKRELELSRRQAAVNRAKYGRLKADRIATGREREKLQQELSDKQREPIPLPVNNKGSAKLAPDREPGKDEDPRQA